MKISYKDLINSVRKSKPQPKVIVVFGQTATGKSALAVKIAKKINGEVISADSRQVYKGLNIGTGKITKKEMRGVVHHLLDVASPKKIFTAAKYQKMSISAMADISKRGKVPIICGGTGFYIDALVRGVVFPAVKPNFKLRAQLLKKDATSLFKLLKKLDPVRAKNIDPKNKIRLVRAIEIARALGRVPKVKITKPPYEFVKIGLYLGKVELKKRIGKRLMKRLKMGMLNEAKRLHKNGLSWRRMEELGLEYKFMALHLQHKITREKMIEKLKVEIYRYAKRQKTWFGKYK